MKCHLVDGAPTCSGSGRWGLLPSSLISAPRALFEPKCLQALASVPCLGAEAAAVPTEQEKQTACCEPAWYPGKKARKVFEVDNALLPAQSRQRQEAMSLLPCFLSPAYDVAEGACLGMRPGDGKHLFSCIHAKKVWDPVNSPSLLLVWKIPPAMTMGCANFSLSLCFLETWTQLSY